MENSIYLVKGVVDQFYSANKDINFYNLIDLLNLKSSTEDIDVEYQPTVGVGDYILNEGSVKRLSNSFSNEVSLFIKNLMEKSIIENLYVILPTKQLEDSLYKILGDIIQECNYSFPNYSNDDVINTFQLVNSEIIGQDAALKSIHSNIMKNFVNEDTKVIMIYGPSGVGKTDAILQIHESIFGHKDIRRIQMSMLNDIKGHDYLFGNDINERSLSEDLLKRKSKFILLDEFDKCNPHLYNAFYQMFDESKYKDNHFEVDLRDNVIFCTSNFQSIEEIIAHVGRPIFSRFDKVVKFEHIANDVKQKILYKHVEEVYKNLLDPYKKQVKIEDIMNILEHESLENRNIREIKNLVVYIFNRYIFNIFLQSK
ncbi:AAA family ATPase [Salinicoccus sp. CNSTN-B1]